MKSEKWIFFLLSLIVFMSCRQTDLKQASHEDQLLDAFNAQEYPAVIHLADSLLLLKPADAATLIIKGRAQINIGLSEEGIHTLSDAIRISPENNNAYFFRAIAYYYQDDLEKGKIDLQHILEREPDNSDYLQMYASNRFQAADYPEIITTYTSLIRLNPELAEYYIQRAAARRETKLFDEAQNDLQHALRIDSTSSFAYEEMGNLLTDQKQYDKAIENFNLSMEFMDNDEIAQIRAAVWASRGFAYFKYGRPELAKADLIRSNGIFPNAAAFKNLALIAVDDGEFKQACIYLSNAKQHKIYHSKTAAAISSLSEQYCN